MRSAAFFVSLDNVGSQTSAFGWRANKYSRVSTRRSRVVGHGFAMPAGSLRFR